MLILWIIFSVAVPFGLFIIGTILYAKLIDTWPAWICWVLALITFGVGIWGSVKANEELYKAPQTIIEQKYNYCPYCGEELYELED